ncbi:hypothetical protein HDU87_000682 [Geranomyces variabilis]|uniref:Uncharacterized protein n=1 Tax=Geranomyces variabilis TaxID=109894 RepID=A0AAD5TT02_9FUNG|nr:hypothetical protein HDU87_000682 [Geranomyces variabilis]
MHRRPSTPGLKNPGSGATLTDVHHLSVASFLQKHPSATWSEYKDALNDALVSLDTLEDERVAARLRQELGKNKDRRYDFTETKKAMQLLEIEQERGLTLRAGWRATADGWATSEAAFLGSKRLMESEPYTPPKRLRPAPSLAPFFVRRAETAGPDILVRSPGTPLSGGQSPGSGVSSADLPVVTPVGTPENVPSNATPAKHMADGDSPPADYEVRKVYQELEGQTQDLFGIDVPTVLRTVLSKTAKVDLVAKNAVEFLALKKCLLLTPSLPAAYSVACTKEKWGVLRKAFKRRVLKLESDHGGRALRPLAVDEGKTIFMPKKCGKTEPAIRLATCVQTLSMHLQADDADEVCENTWTPHFVAPYFYLLADQELRIK